MKILCIHFKGGVGKSTTAVHLAGVLFTAGNTLLIDADKQATSYKFFNGGQKPADYELLTVDDFLSVIPLYAAKKVNTEHLGERVNKIKKIPYDHLVVDSTGDSDIVLPLLAEIKPDKIVIPVKQDDLGGFAQLDDILTVIAQYQIVDISPEVMILPIGDCTAKIYEYTRNIHDIEYQVSNVIPFNFDLFGVAVYKEFKFVWQYDGFEELYKVYASLVGGFADESS